MFLIRGIVFSYEAVRDWEAKLTPTMAEALRRRRLNPSNVAVQGGIEMHMRIIWGTILPGQWDAFEAAFKKALEIRGEVKGLKSQWLLRDENDPDAGYAISQWESDEDMRAFWDSKKRRDAMAVLQPFFVNQFTITNCAIRVAISH
jgi:heme-degrading monooxygenase HmoA